MIDNGAIIFCGQSGREKAIRPLSAVLTLGVRRVGASARGRDHVVRVDVGGGSTAGGSRLGHPGGGCSDPRQAGSSTTGGGSSDGRAVAQFLRRALSVDTPLCHRCPMSTTSPSTWFLVGGSGCAPAVRTGAAMHGLASHRWVHPTGTGVLQVQRCVGAASANCLTTAPPH